MSRVLVTGGAGFIGSHVVDSLIEAGHEVVVVDDLSRGRRRNVNPKARFYRIDIRKEELASILAHERPEYASHHAAHVDLRRSLEDPLHNASANIMGSVRGAWGRKGKTREGRRIAVQRRQAEERGTEPVGLSTLKGFQWE